MWGRVPGVCRQEAQNTGDDTGITGKNSHHLETPSPPPSEGGGQLQGCPDKAGGGGRENGGERILC